MGRVRGKMGNMTKGGYKTHRSKRPAGVSRSGLPKIYPPHVDAQLRAQTKK
jgi:hypothetical protein